MKKGRIGTPLVSYKAKHRTALSTMMMSSNLLLPIILRSLRYELPPQLIVVSIQLSLYNLASKYLLFGSTKSRIASAYDFSEAVNITS